MLGKTQWRSRKESSFDSLICENIDVQASSFQSLLFHLYDQWQQCSVENESWTETSLFSEGSARCDFQDSCERYRESVLHSKSVKELKEIIGRFEQEVQEISLCLVRHLKRRDRQSSRNQARCNLITAVLQALSPKRSVDAKLQFSLEPPPTDSGFDQWLNAMRAVAKLPDGIPQDFRRKLWLTLADYYIQSQNMNWDEIRRATFNSAMCPDDENIGVQIIKDLHRTGWSGLNGEHERILLKRVLLAYARYNKVVGYCQGFNVIAALILEIMDYKEEDALKVMILLIEKVLPAGYYDQTLRALSVDMAVLRDLLNQRLPKLSNHLEMLQKTSESEYEPPLTNVFTMQWFLTLFATVLPKNVVFRVWDSLMLEGSEILLRVALALWAKIGRRAARAETADEFYSLMGPLTQELLFMSPEHSNDLLQLIYGMESFPYPGLEELRERYTWNIQPLSSNFKLFKSQVQQILQPGDEANALAPGAPGEGTAPADQTTTCMSGFISPEKFCAGANSGSGKARDLQSRQNSNASATDVTALQKQYNLMKQRQKQAAVILQNAYAKGAERLTNVVGNSPSSEESVFNHLYVGKTSQINRVNNVHMMNGAIPLASKVVQPQNRQRNLQNLTKSLGERTPTRSRPRETSFSEDFPQIHFENSRRWRSFDASFLFVEEFSVVERRTKSCPELRNWFRKSIRKNRRSPLPSSSSSIPSVPSTPTTPNSPKHGKTPNFYSFSPMQPKNKEKKNPMLIKSKQIINSVSSPEAVPPPSFYPFPIRHQSKLVERGKQWGLYG